MMKERLKELLKQSGAYDYYEVNEGVEGDEKPMEKFAELIIEECGKVAYEETVHFPKPCDWLLDKFKRHFGVKQ